MGDVSNAVLFLCAKGNKREEVSGNNKVISYINFMPVTNSFSNSNLLSPLN